MILYFSGTGNSKYVAKRIADALGDALVNLNDRIKASDTSPVETDERLIIVTPTYAWRIPRVVRDWLRKTELRGAKQVWFVMTCGSEIGSADKYNRALCREKGLTCMGTAQLIMPENYIAMFDAPQEPEAARIIEASAPAIDEASQKIADGCEFAAPRNNLYDRFMSTAANPVFYALFVKADKFRADDKCVGCGKCAQLCPLNDISIVDDRPAWGKNCTHCMACICHCPTGAIEYGRKSLGKPRYHCDL